MKLENKKKYTTPSFMLIHEHDYFENKLELSLKILLRVLLIFFLFQAFYNFEQKNFYKLYIGFFSNF